MKTKFVTALIGFVIVFSMTAKAQFAFVEPSTRAVPAYLRALKQNFSEPAYYNNISTRAVRNFVKDFPEVSNENWSKCAQNRPIVAGGSNPAVVIGSVVEFRPSRRPIDCCRFQSVQRVSFRRRRFLPRRPRDRSAIRLGNLRVFQKPGTTSNES